MSIYFGTECPVALREKITFFFLRSHVLFVYSYVENTHNFHRLVHMAQSSVYTAVCTLK